MDHDLAAGWTTETPPLTPGTEDRFVKHPSRLAEVVSASAQPPTWVVVDEVQKAPRVLDVVHQLIENEGVKFALTGSSARKLKRGASNLLAGRAFVYHLFPFTHRELGERFSLEHALQWGTLPKTFTFVSDEERALFLEAYCHTYLKEEILAEQLIRRERPFRLFLEVAAQSNGEILNYSNIASDIGVDSKTVKSYFQILEDTLVGFLVPGYHRSLRKQQTLSPKFYLFDTGVKRALAGALSLPLQPRTYDFGRAFEHFIVAEAHRLNSNLRRGFRFYHLLTKDRAEIDLVIERPGRPLALVEIKSAVDVGDRHLRTIQRFASELDDAEAFCLSREATARQVGKVRVLPWMDGLAEIGLAP